MGLLKKIKSIRQQWATIVEMEETIRDKVIEIERKEDAIGDRITEIENKGEFIRDKVVEIENQGETIRDKIIEIENKEETIRNKIIEIENKEATVENKITEIENQEEVIRDRIIEIENKEETIGERVLGIENKIELVERSVEDSRRIDEKDATIKQAFAFIAQEKNSISISGDNDLFLEETLLAECDIRKLLMKLEELLRDARDYCFVSNLVSDDLTCINQEENKKNMQEWEKGEKSFQRVFLLNIRNTYQFIEDTHLKYNITRIKDAFIFLMPRIADDSLQVLWGEGFGETEIDVDSYWRWYIGEEHIGKIIIHNSYDYYKVARICFASYTANPNAYILVKSGSTVHTIDIRRDEHTFDITTVLAPGYNELELFFCGEVCNLNEAEQRQCQFTVTNFRIYEAEKDIWYTGADVYAKQYNARGARYVMSDRHIRNRLHENGFFEIESFCCNMDGIYPMKTTRAYVAYGGYYTLEKAHELPEETDDLVLYVARRRGKMRDEK